jgi:hypothetical protein
MPFKVDAYCNKIKEVVQVPSTQNHVPADSYFETEYEALRFMFDRSIKRMDDLADEAEKLRITHNRMCRKYGQRLRDLKPGNPKVPQ